MMEEESTSDSLSIQSPILLQDSVPEINESFDHQQYQESQNEISFEYSQQFNFPHSQKDVNDDTHISSSSSLAIGNLHGSGSILSPALAPAQSLFAQISELIPLAQQNQTQAISSSKYKTTIDMLEDLDSQLPDYSLHKRSKYENMSQLSNYRPNSQITPAGLRQGTNIKPVQVNKELISSILKKLPWLNLSVNTISQNLSQHEVKILLRYKNIDVHSTSGVKKTALCETLLRVLREDRFKEEMLSINAHVTTGSISSISSVVIADKSIGRPGSSLISSSEKGNSVIADASTGDKDRPALSYSSSTSISTSDKTPIPIIKSSPHQEVQTIGSGSGSASANQKSVAGQTTLQSKTPKCQISSDFFNDSKWRPPSVSYSLLTTPVVEKARPVSSLVYFRDREECINSSGLFEPTPSNRGRTDSQSTRCESMKGWKQIQSKDLRDALAEEDCHFTIRALRQHLEQLPNQTHGQGRLIANKQQVPSIESPNFDLECTDGHGVYSNEAIPTISSEVSKCLKNGPLREILRHLTDKYNRTIKSKVETTQSDNTEQIVISITRPCAEIGTQTDFPDDTFITGRSVNAPSRQSETDPDYYQTSLSLSHLFPRSSRFGTVRLVQFHGARLGLSLVRSSSKHKPTPTVSLPTAAHTGHTTSTGSMRVASVDTIIESVIVQAKNKLLLTQEAMSGIQVGDELVSINGICPLAGLYTFAQQMDMIKTSTRPLVLGFATIY